MDNHNSHAKNPDSDSVSERKNPYVGPRPFRFGEPIFGRDREKRNLFDLLIAERIVLLNSPSGAGKTSLVQAGLLPRLKQEGFNILPVVRVGNLPEQEFADVENLNRYMFSVLQSLESEKSEGERMPRRQLAGLSLSDYLAQRLDKTSSHAYVMVFDQFEEVITTDPSDKEGKHAFFFQLGEALRDRNLWSLFVIRDDYLGALDSYVLPVPTQLTNFFHLDFLDHQAAMDAIQKPIMDQGIIFTYSAAQNLVNDLRRVQVLTPGGEMITELGPYVEPVQLQVVCLRLYDELDLANNLEKREISERDIAEVGDVNQALGQFYSDRISAIAKQNHVSERLIRDWFAEQLITLSGFRDQVMMDQETSGGLDNKIVRLLEDSHLIRAEKRRGRTWFELAHDRLIAPVLEDNDAWERENLVIFQRRANEWRRHDLDDRFLLRGRDLENAESWAARYPDQLIEIDRRFLDTSQEWYLAHLSPLQRRALEWENKDRPANLLMRGEELGQAGIWAAEHLDELTTREQEFLDAGRQLAESEERERREQQLRLQYERQRADEQAEAATRLRRRAIALSISTVLAIALFAFAIFFANNASQTALTNATLAAQNAAFANEQSIIAAQEARNASTQSALLIQSQINAGTQSALAREKISINAIIALTSMAGEDEARQSQATAVYNQRLALSRQLASQGKSYLDRNSELGTLLSIESYEVLTTTWDARSALLASLQAGLEQNVQPYALVIPTQLDFTNSIGISSDGKRIAWSGARGRIVIWDVAQKKIITSLQNPARASITSQAFSPIDPDLLVTGSLNNSILFWDLADGTFVQKDASQTGFPRAMGKIRCLAFSGDGKYLAVCGETSIIEIWDVAQQAQVRAFDTAAAYFWKLDWSPNNQYLAAAGSDNRLYIFDPFTGNVIDSEENPEGQGQIYAVHWAPDSRILAFGGSSGSRLARVHFYDISAKQVQNREIQLESSNIFNLAYGSNGNLLAQAGWNESVYLWDIEEDKELARLPEYGDFQNGLALKKNILAYLGKDTVSVYTLMVPQSLVLETKTVPRRVLDISQDLQGNIWVAGHSGLDISLRGLSNGELMDYRPNLRLSADSILSRLTPGPNGLLLLTSNGLGQVELWNSANGQIMSLTGLPEPLHAMAINPDGATIAVSYCATPENEQPEAICAAQIQFWDVASQSSLGSPISTSQDKVSSLVFSPDGSSLASGSQDGSIMLWDWRNGQSIGIPLGGFTAKFSALSYSPDGTILASGTEDGLLFLWDVQSGQVLGKPFKVGVDPIEGLAFSSDGKYLYTASANGEVSTWDVDFESWVIRACNLAGRDLSDGERRQFLPVGENGPNCSEIAEFVETPVP
jgi:WD40 repeat protein